MIRLVTTAHLALGHMNLSLLVESSRDHGFEVFSSVGCRDEKDRVYAVCAMGGDSASPTQKGRTSHNFYLTVVQASC